jgi:hypothetical protein
MVQCKICVSADVGGPDGSVTGSIYLSMLRGSVPPVIHQFYGNEPFYFQQDGASLAPERLDALFNIRYLRVHTST